MWDRKLVLIIAAAQASIRRVALSLETGQTHLR
jgi:hypothetical protein